MWCVYVTFVFFDMGYFSNFLLHCKSSENIWLCYGWYICSGWTFCRIDVVFCSLCICPYDDMRCCVSFVVIIFRSFKKLRRSGEFKKQLKAVYNNIYSKNFNAEDFIYKNKEVIDTLPLEPEEHAIIKDLFTYKYIPDKEYMPDICTIC